MYVSFLFNIIQLFYVINYLLFKWRPKLDLIFRIKKFYFKFSFSGTSYDKYYSCKSYRDLVNIYLFNTFYQTKKNISIYKKYMYKIQFNIYGKI